MEYLVDYNPDITFVTETWLQSEFNEVTAKVKTYGYRLIHRPRLHKRGGGVGIIMRSQFAPVNLSYRQFSSFEHILQSLKLSNGVKLVLVSFYRLQEVSPTVFLEEFSCLLEHIILMSDSIIISGDSNIHCDNITDNLRNKFYDVLSCFNLIQHVVDSTHKGGHILDVVIGTDNSNIISPSVNDVNLSDHYPITFDVEFSTDVSTHKVIQYRQLDGINAVNFSNDLSNCVSEIVLNDFNSAVNSYNSSLSSILDKHAPLKSKRIKIVHNAPWFDGEYQLKRRARRKAEKKWKRSNLLVDKQIFTNLRKETTQLALQKKVNYYSEKVNSAKGDQSKLFKMVDTLLDVNQESLLPHASCNVELANEFNYFFTSKIVNLRQGFPCHNLSTSALHDRAVLRSSKVLTEFAPTSVEELREIVKDTGIKCSPSDPLPGNVVNGYIDILLPFWCKLVNVSLSTGSLDGVKQSDVTPLIKKPNLDKDTFGNYRPISNLQFIGKLIERVVLKRLTDHMDRHQLHITHQSGYRKYHSTETTLLKIVNDILCASDAKNISVLILLDLSAAFDTVDHDKLLSILYHDIGISGIAFNWIKSFLAGRSQRVKVGSIFSSYTDIEYGVPQGSVLGPVLFNIYIRSLYMEIQNLGFKIEGYADDHQVYKSFSPAFQARVLNHDIQQCFSVLTAWMNSHFLCLNPSKTEIILVGHEGVLRDITIGGTFINATDCVRFADSAKSLGVCLDNRFTFGKQIYATASLCFATLRKLAKLKPYLNSDQLRTLVTALILSKIDYCNSLYYGINQNLVYKLQTVQNCAARLILVEKKENMFQTSFFSSTGCAFGKESFSK